MNFYAVGLVFLSYFRSFILIDLVVTNSYELLLEYVTADKISTGR